MPAAIDAIRSEHRTMSRLLDLLETQIDLFEDTERPDYNLIKEILDYFLTFPDLYHHPKEDLIFRKLKRRAPDSASRFGDLEEQHEEISERLHTFTRAVVNVMLEAEMPRDVFVKMAREFISGERLHMAGEETAFLPAALRYLSDDDWKEIDAKVDGFSDPLGGEDIKARFSTLSERLKRWRAGAD